MIAFLARRLLGAALVLLGASFITFSLMSLAPGDPALAMAEARYGSDTFFEQATLDTLRAEAGLDRPFLVRYADWLGHVLRLDLGQSLLDRRPVVDELGERLARTAELAAAALGVAVALSLPLGLLAGIYAGTWFDSLCVTFATLGAAMPNFWLGVLLIVVFAVWLGWLPAFGRGGLAHLVLPAVTLGTGITVYTARLLRSSVIEILGSGHLAATRGRGIGEVSVIGRHALRNALIPVVTIFALEIGFLIEGAVAVEYVFSWNGVGQLFVDAVDGRDLPVIQAVVLMTALAFVTLNLAVDLLYWWLDPRTRTTMG